MSIKYIDIKEFREFGYLQEVNRQFFHPLGLALEVKIDEETGEEMLGGIWDYRDDPEGMVFSDLSEEESRLKSVRVAEAGLQFKDYRQQNLGFVVQPIGNKLIEDDLIDESA